jgi:RNA polymerase I-specific transcription initiation factor RRN3
MDVSVSPDNSPAPVDPSGIRQVPAAAVAATVDGDLRLPPCPVPTREDLERVEVFVTKAIQEHQEDPESTTAFIPSKKYQALIEGFRTRQNLSLLTNVLISLRTTGSSLTMLASDVAKHARLIRLIIRFDPFKPVKVTTTTSNGETGASPTKETTINFDLVDALLHLFLALGTANSVYCAQILSALWELLVGTFNSKSNSDLNERRVQRLHAAIATLLDLCPSNRTTFFTIIQDQAPFWLRPAPQLEFYHAQSLSVLRYIPRCQPQIMALLVRRALAMDVQIKITDTGDVMLDKGENGQVENNNPEKVVETSNSVNALAEKLDSLMLLLFEHCRRTDPVEQYQLLAPIFQEHIVNTKKSKFVQFLLLAATEQSHREFLVLLIELLLDVERAMVTRHAAACYVASYVSRCQYVTAETAAEAVDALLRWAEEYIKTMPSNSQSHSLFYTVCQAAFYIMAFRGASLLSFDEFRLGKDRWQPVCGHGLQPLNYCLESVKAEFLILATTHGLVDENVLQRTILPKKPKRKSIAISSPAKLERARGGVGGLGQGDNPLDSFFPFDPYLLRRSYPCIEECFRHWDGGKCDDDTNAIQNDDKDIPHSVDVDLSSNESVEESSDLDDDENDDLRAATRKRLLSIASNATSISSAPVNDSAAKRTRALSMEDNGSW